ncbi:MAG TPA: cellulase family glycosylhydrolase [Chloroflexia bacterium]|nr:cellulase family glycosylhydrolase [Chloroflexia bacterium]
MASKRAVFHLATALLLVLIVLIQPLSSLPVSASSNLATSNVDQAKADANDGDQEGFVTRKGSILRLNGKEFRFGGTNTYYLTYKSHAMVDDVLTTAAANNFNVLRTWGSLDIGNQDGSNSINGKSDGVYYQYWNGTAPTYNDGPDGLQHLDYAIYRAGQLGIKLVIPFVNNWNAFGGMDQYVRWRNGQYHDQFYSDPVIQGWFKSWISHLLNHTNYYTGIQYKNDPTIMMWELANEPRCKSAGAYPQSSTCNTQTLTSWADRMSRYIKDIDENHLLSVGDEGFYCSAGTDWTENCGEGVDNLALTALKHIDVMSLHAYPDSWGKDAAWTTNWISRHIQDAKNLNKAVLLGEFGFSDKSTRNAVYKQWTETVINNGGNGFLFWMLAGKQDDGTYYPDYDGFTVYCPGPVCTNLSDHALMIKGNKRPFAPVADNDSAVTQANTAVTLTPLANDIALGSATLVPGSIDLDPASAGQQSSFSVAGQGTFATQPDGSVTFTPATDFAGKVSASYTVQDSTGQVSNVASLSVLVKGSSTSEMLYSFEDGTEGWASADWQAPGTGTLTQSADFHTDGNSSLKLDVSSSGGWFGLQTASTLDLSGKTHFLFDVKTGAASTSMNVAFKVGDSWTWCQGNWGNINANSTTTYDVDLTQGLSCSLSDLAKVHAIYVWFSAGSYYLDAVRAE